MNPKEISPLNEKFDYILLSLLGLALIAGLTAAVLEHFVDRVTFHYLLIVPQSLLLLSALSGVVRMLLLKELALFYDSTSKKGGPITSRDRPGAYIFFLLFFMAFSITLILIIVNTVIEIKTKM